MRKITEIKYNWRIEGDIKDGICDEYSFSRVGQNGVIEIRDNTPCGEDYTGTAVFEILYKNGDIEIIFNPNYVKSVEV